MIFLPSGEIVPVISKLESPGSAGSCMKISLPLIKPTTGQARKPVIRTRSSPAAFVSCSKVHGSPVDKSIHGVRPSPPL